MLVRPTVQRTLSLNSILLYIVVYAMYAVKQRQNNKASGFASLSKEKAENQTHVLLFPNHLYFDFYKAQF